MAKIDKETVERLRSLIAPLDTDEVRCAYRRGEFPLAELVRDLDMRYRWDLLNAAGGWRLTAPLYDDGCNDTHIDTALRAIVPAL